ncbi:spermine oxidase [Bombyx mori]|uniref:Amine oxidase domain-containing protein n=1 Tax=Bombyx mori TaxID=7091 RepID=A0A8R2C7N8_BOMMO|nr:spermine oxidase [Bombyx mori]
MDVIVIGCGAAGVAALRKLHDAGLRVLGLEAADRIGGRICTIEYGDSTLDIGAAWCHGEKDNIVFELAEPLGLLGRPDPHDSWYVLSNGDLAPDATCKEILANIDEEVCKSHKNNVQSISQFVRNAVNTKETFKQFPRLTRSLLEVYERNNHLGGQDDPQHGKSLKGLDEHWPCEGEFLLNWRGRGYKTLLDVLLNKYPDPNEAIPVQILLNKHVECIRWGTSQPSHQISPLVQVKCTDGSLYAAKSVIVTLPLAVLKETHAQLFSPPLPQDKINSINSLHYCVLDKIYIEFTTPWWPKSAGKFVILWQEEDKAKFTKEEHWITEIYGLDPVQHQPNVLLAWIYGKGAEAMEKVSFDDLKAGIDKLLSIFKKKFPVTPVKSVLRSQWASNLLARSAYAYRCVATEENGASATTLSEPIYHGNGLPLVCFAGEATSYHRHSAVHGAVESGFREAQRLMDSFGKTNVKPNQK